MSAASASSFSLLRAASTVLMPSARELAGHRLAKPGARAGDDRDALAEVDGGMAACSPLQGSILL